MTGLLVGPGCYAVSFNTREISTGLWLAVILVWVLFSPARRVVPGLIRAAAAPKILGAVAVAALFTTGVVLVLWRVGVWTIAELKDTIIWFLFSGIALAFRGVNTPHPDRIVHASIWDAVRLTVLMEFLLSTYTFPLLVEILLLPFAALIAAMLVIAQSEKQFASVASFLGKLQVALGSIVIGATVWSATHDFQALWSRESARRLSTPIFLGLAFVPLAYFMALVAGYESLFLPLKIYNVPIRLRLYAEARLIAMLKYHLKAVCIAKQRLRMPLGKVSSLSDIDKALSHLSVKIPAPVPPGADAASYWAGYKLGLDSAPADLATRMAVEEHCDAIIGEQHYDQQSFDEGFGAGRQDFDLG